MANYSLRSFLRSTQNALLKEFFRKREILNDFEWSMQDETGHIIPLSETKVNGLEEAIELLPPESRFKLEQEFEDITYLADENSNFCLIEQANRPKFGINLAEEFAQQEIDGYFDRSIWAYMHHNDLFKYTYKYMQVISTARSRDFLVGKLKCRVNEKAKTAFRESIIKHYVGRGRGENCLIDHYDRNKDTEQHCFYIFQEDCVKSVLGFNADGTDVIRNPQRQLIENIFFYEPKTGNLRIHATGEKNTEALADIFCTHILGLEGRPNRNTMVYDLSKLLTPGFVFNNDPRIEKLNLKEIICDMGNHEEVVLKVKGRERKGILLLQRLHAAVNSYAVAACDVMVTKLRFQVEFAKQEGIRKKTRTREIELPNKTDLTEDDYDAIIRKHIEGKWGFKRRLLSDDKSNEAA